MLPIILELDYYGSSSTMRAIKSYPHIHNLLATPSRPTNKGLKAVCQIIMLILTAAFTNKLSSGLFNM